MAWYDLDFEYRKSKVITGGDSVADFQIAQLTLNWGNGEDGDTTIYFNEKAKTYFDDLRVCDSDGTTLIPFYLRNCTSTTAELVIMTSVSVGGKTIYLYYGNSDASSASSGTDTFQWFDDFQEVSSTQYAQIASVFRPMPWTWYSSNPIMTKTGVGFESLGLRDPVLMIDTSGNLVVESGKYIMYYTGYKSASPHYERAIGRATIDSDNITVTRYGSNPVLSGDGAGWESFGIQSPCVIKRGENDYIMYYSGVGADWTMWGVGIATSTDGLSWSRYGSNPIFTSDSWNLHVGGSDVVTGVRVIKLSTGNWLMVVYGVYEDFVDGTSHSYFAIYGAISTDSNGVTDWVVLNGGDPILLPSDGQWDEDNIETASLVEVSDGTVVMFYVGSDRSIASDSRAEGGGDPASIGAAYASTNDLTSWTKYTDNPIMLQGSYGEWNDGQVETLFIAKDDIGTNSIRAWFSGNPYDVNGDRETDSAFGFATCSQLAKKYTYTDKWTNVGSVKVELVSYSAILGDVLYALRLRGSDSHTVSLINNTGTYGDFILEAYVKPTMDSNTYSLPYLTARYTDMDNRYFIILRGEATNDVFIRRVEGGSNYLSSSDAFNYTSKWYDFKAVFVGTNIKIYLDEVLIANQTDGGSGITSGKIGITNFRPTEAVLFDYVSVSKYTASPPTWGATGEEEITIGWTGIINGITNPAKINGISVADIAKVNGIAAS